MKFKPLYLYGIIFVVIIVAIVLTSSGNSNVDTANNSMTAMQNDANQGMGEMPNDAIHNGMSGMNEGAPSKNNVRADFYKQLDTYEEELKNNPNDTTIMRNYADLLGMSHQTEKAIDLYNRILAIDPNRVDILISEGVVFYNSNKIDEAEVVTKKIVSLDKNNIEAKYNLGVIAATKGNNNEAIKIWEKLVEKYPDTEVGKLSKEALGKMAKL